MATKLTAEALEGYKAEPGTRCPYYATSASGMAWEVGAMFRSTGRPEPRDVRTGRGYLINVADMAFNCRDAHDGKIERVK